MIEKPIPPKNVIICDKCLSPIIDGKRTCHCVTFHVVLAILIFIVTVEYVVFSALRCFGWLS